MEGFQCLGPECPDTCCHGWSMPIDAAQIEHCQANAPELLAFIDKDAKEMRRDEAGSCTALEGGFCGIHAKYGEGFLGDSCHFFPRLFQRRGEESRMAASLSCPEAARRFATHATPLALVPLTIDRLPPRIAAPCADAREEALHERCTDFAQDSSYTPEAIMARLIRQSYRWEALPREQWVWEEHRTPTTPESRASDPLALLYALMLLIRFSGHRSIRLKATVAMIEHALAATLDWDARTIQSSPDTVLRIEALRAAPASAAAQELLRRWIALQLVNAAFPFGGLHRVTIRERITLIAVRFATLRLALVCGPDDATVQVDTVQHLARLHDHLSDPTLPLTLYADAGWANEARLLGLVV